MYMLMTCLFLTVSSPTLSMNEPDPIVEELPTPDEEIIQPELDLTTIENALLILIVGSGTLLGSQFGSIFTKHFSK